jgi:hypothetical protein
MSEGLRVSEEQGERAVAVLLEIAEDKMVSDETRLSAAAQVASLAMSWADGGVTPEDAARAIVEDLAERVVERMRQDA